MTISDWIWKRSDNKDKFSFDSEAEKEWAEILNNLVKDDSSNGSRVGKKIMVSKKNTNSWQFSLFDETDGEHVSETSPVYLNRKIKSNYTGETKPVYLWGKNYVPNSQIKFEYYLNGVHSSYPDFVMKDSYDRIHIFEVKSVNVSSSMAGSFDSTLYNEKLAELKKAYKYASKLTKQIFYLPVLKDDTWRIFQYIEGVENTLAKEQFLKFCRNK
jgi:type III restriction enzyme